ncbi:MAG: hypothetical protein H0W30_18635 [Gemmatimonadaceae bacterium]|nr:hypothetical protein [Gemmatimonadaceae bacterium]
MQLIPTAIPRSAGRRASRAWVVPALLSVLIAFSACSDDDDDDDDVTGPGSLFVVQDAANDILPSYTGPAGADLDVRRAEVTYDGTNFVFTSTLAGTIGTTPGALFVWGVDRGQGTPRFGDIATGVHFDLVVVGRADGTGTVTDLTAAPPTSTTLAAGNVVVSGNTLRITVSATLLPSKGFSTARYTANFWPRVGAGNNNQIADFAPDNQNLQIRAP